MGRTIIRNLLLLTTLIVKCLRHYKQLVLSSPCFFDSKPTQTWASLQSRRMREGASLSLLPSDLEFVPSPYLSAPAFVFTP